MPQDPKGLGQGSYRVFQVHIDALRAIGIE